MSARDGGTAFPRPCHASDGMSLRDWFAGQALAGLMSAHDEKGIWSTVGADFEAARFAYTVADAMLAERERSER